MPAPAPLRPSDDELRHLYLDERMAAQAIADRCQVRKITVLRWLRAAGIERRPIGRGLANRGVIAPTAEQLHMMIHIDHLSYAQVAEIYGVDYTAVPHWLAQHGIPKPTIWDTRRKGVHPVIPDASELARRYQAGESLAAIGRTCGVVGPTIRRRLVSADIQIRRDGWKNGVRLLCHDGHEARSVYEKRVDDWLYQHGVAHEVEPVYPWDRRYRADYLVGGIYIEVWGVTDNESYRRRKQMKIKRCREAGVDLIGINCWQFAKGRRWWRPLERLARSESTTGDLF